MMKRMYTPPETLNLQLRMEGPLCASGTGEDFNPWDGDTFSAPAIDDIPSFIF